MADHPHEERLASHLKAGVAALRAGRPDQALLHFSPVVDDPVLAASDDLADIRARACCLLAQAILDTLKNPAPSDFSRVESLLDEATRLDPEAASGAQPLRARMLDGRQEAMEREARVARSKRLANTDIAPLLARITDPGRRLDLLLQKAQAELDEGRQDVAITLAMEVLDAPETSEVRHQVMAHLTLARARPQQATPHVLAAYKCADDASEFNLVGTVGRTAELLGVELPAQHGPLGSEPS